MQRVVGSTLVAFLTAISLSAQVPPKAVVGKAGSTRVDSAGREVAKAVRPQRLLGVYDDEGEAQDYEVIDLVADRVAKVGKKGPISLGFLSTLPDSLGTPSGAIVVRKIGFADTTIVVALGPTDTLPVTVFLSRAVALPAVTVNAAITRSELESRTRAFAGKFIAPGVMRSAKYEGKDLRAALKDAEIVGEFPSRYGQKAAPKTVMPGGSRRPSGCTVKIILDGSASSGELVSLDDPAAMYDAAEFYPSPVNYPEEYRKYIGGCGTLLLWTRAR